METMGLISLGVVGSILPGLVRSVGFTLHMGVEVLVAAALPLLHTTKAGQWLQPATRELGASTEKVFFPFVLRFTFA